ncbi:uncharacterized protein [Salminus brasiliensis]|uniref:uncharacterized protein n=1 Tax=Salminus brasiliensis TaxID=930266 RepID=UPI003B83A2E8
MAAALSAGSHRSDGGGSGAHRPGAPFDSKRGVSSSSPPSALPLLPPPPPSEARPLGASLGLPLAGGSSYSQDVEQDPEPSPSEEEMQEDEDSPGNSAGLECGQAPIEEDQMVEERRGVCVAEVRAGGLACSLCKQLFSSLLQLRQHEYGHTLSLMALSLDCLEPQRPLMAPSSTLEPPPPPPRYHCSRCPASFTLKSNADRHEKTIHFKRKLMRCPYCLKHFRDRTDLNRHLSSVHSSERVYTCPACTRAFSTQKNLATHTKVCCQAGAAPIEPLWNSHALREEVHSDLRLDHSAE